MTHCVVLFITQRVMIVKRKIYPGRYIVEQLPGVKFAEQ
jgi:hypothetical protein